jgi:hypothetical protein
LFSQTRVQTRALTGALLCGAGLGLVLAAAFVIGGTTAKTAYGDNLNRLGAQAPHALRDSAPPRVVVDLTPGRIDWRRRSVNARAPSAFQPEPGLFHAAVLQAAPPFRFLGPVNASHDLDCLTAAVYYEARGEVVAGQAAVAQVVLNRVRNPAFPKTVCGVVYQGAGTGSCQFSFACNGAMVRERETGAWDRARGVAARALAGYVMHDVGRATHFHVASLGEIWGGQMIRVAQVGEHVFYGFGGRRGAIGSGAVTPSTDVAKDAPSSDAAGATLASAAAPAAKPAGSATLVPAQPAVVSTPS